MNLSQHDEMPESRTTPIRIQKVIAQAGIASRRAAEKMIEGGLVTLNGKRATLGQKMHVGVDRLEVEGERVQLSKKQKKVVYALYKPKNCITTLNDPEGRPTVKDFFPNEAKKLFPVGRLDYDAEGLLLITNDGDFAQSVIHPRYKIWKTYFVKVKGIIEVETLNQLRKGPTLEGQKRMPVKVKIVHTVNDKTWLEVSLQEGKNQQIKKMFKKFDSRVLKIKRYSIGPITIDELLPGMMRKLAPHEISRLLSISKNSK